MDNNNVIDRQLECLSIAKTLATAFKLAIRKPGAEPLSSGNVTAYTLFFDPSTGLASFDFEWDQGDAHSQLEQAFCQQSALIVAGYFTQYEIASLSTLELARRIYPYLSDLPPDSD